MKANFKLCLDQCINHVKELRSNGYYGDCHRVFGCDKHFYRHVEKFLYNYLEYRVVVCSNGITHDIFKCYVMFPADVDLSESDFLVRELKSTQYEINNYVRESLCCESGI